MPVEAGNAMIYAVKTQGIKDVLFVNEPNNGTPLSASEIVLTFGSRQSRDPFQRMVGNSVLSTNVSPYRGYVISEDSVLTWITAFSTNQSIERLRIYADDTAILDLTQGNWNEPPFSRYDLISAGESISCLTGDGSEPTDTADPVVMVGIRVRDTS
ncbi:MAG: hypothetical protein ACW99U_21180 [Candidatus Thorarchaeota archaeon]|jgi:hypothetical protein